MKTLINLKINDNRCFIWHDIRHLNPLKTHSERIKKAEKRMLNDLDNEVIEFLVSRRDFSKIEKKYLH